MLTRATIDHVPPIFEDELRKLRPHVGERLAATLALQMYHPDEQPREMARQYDKSLGRYERPYLRRPRNARSDAAP